LNSKQVKQETVWRQTFVRVTFATREAASFCDVCLYNFRKPWRRKFTFWFAVNILQQKTQNFLFPQCKPSIGNNSGSMEDRAAKSACRMGFSDTAERMMWPSPLSRDRKYTYLLVVCLRWELRQSDFLIVLSLLFMHSPAISLWRHSVFGLYIRACVREHGILLSACRNLTKLTTKVQLYTEMTSVRHSKINGQVSTTPIIVKFVQKV